MVTFVRVGLPRALPSVDPQRRQLIRIGDGLQYGSAQDRALQPLKVSIPARSPEQPMDLRRYSPEIDGAAYWLPPRSKRFRISLFRLFCGWLFPRKPEGRTGRSQFNRYLGVRRFEHARQHVSIDAARPAGQRPFWHLATGARRSERPERRLCGRWPWHGADGCRRTAGS